LPLIESNTGHGRAQTDFAIYGIVGYMFDQKLQVNQKIEI
jgi:hypothetical protein